MAKKEVMAVDTEVSAKKTDVYSKAEILASKRFMGVERDILNSLLKDGEMYEVEQVKGFIEKYLKGGIR